MNTKKRLPNDINKNNEGEDETIYKVKNAENNAAADLPEGKIDIDKNDDHKLIDNDKASRREH